VCCSVLQCVAVCCSVCTLTVTMEGIEVLMCRSVLQCVVLECVAACVQCVAVCARLKSQ